MNRCKEVYEFLRGLRNCKDIKNIEDIIKNDWDKCFKKICPCQDIVSHYQFFIQCARCKIYECFISGNCTLWNILSELIWLDFIRFHYNPDWLEPPVGTFMHRYIFTNPDPDEALTIFTMLNFINAQINPKTVYTTYAQRIYNYFRGTAPLPRLRNRVSNRWLASISGFIRHQRLSYWFADTILNIVNRHGCKPGNIYRFAGRILQDLLGYPPSNPLVQRLNSGLPPNKHIKRLWMHIMFLRRDRCFIKDLVVRAMRSSGHPQWLDALCYWYDDSCFDENEIELPVDRRVMNAWNGILAKINPHYKSSNPQQVAVKARGIAHSYNIPPSVFDVLYLLWE